MTLRDIARLRLVNQRISAGAATKPGVVVAALGAMQAQDYLGALWSIGLRTAGLTEAEVEESISRREIVRTWPMRGTLHFVAAEDVRWMLKLLTPRIISASAGRQRELELDGAIFARSRKLFTRALQGGRTLTREAMCGLLDAAGISTAANRGYHLLWRNAQEGLLCFASRLGKQQTFALLEEWVPEARCLDREESLAELARRYFTSHGPARLQDFIGWSGLTASDAKAGLAMVESRFMRETVEGNTYLLPEDAPTPPKSSRSAYLLPGFDEFILGYKDRSASLDPLHSQKIIPGNNGMFMPTIVIDGQVAGTWSRTVKAKSVLLKIMPFQPLKKSETGAIKSAFAPYSRFIGLPAEMSGGVS